MKNIVFLFEAEQEMNAAATYYNRQEKGLGLDFLNEVDQCLHRIRNSPKRWLQIAENIHKYSVKRFPFYVIYRNDPYEICILAIAHQKRKWDYWKSRI